MKYSIVTSACIVHPDSLKKSETPHKHLHGGDVNQEFFPIQKPSARLDRTNFLRYRFFFSKNISLIVLSDVLN